MRAQCRYILATLFCVLSVEQGHSQDLQTRFLRLMHPNGSSTYLQGQSDSGSVTITLPSRSGRLAVEGAGGGSDSTPTGMITLYAALPLPSGYLECNGAAVSRTTYPELFSLLGETYGPGDASTTFSLPTLPSPVPQARQDLMGDWRFSNNLDDSSGQGHPAALLNGAQYAVDRGAVQNHAVALDGINDQVKINAPFFDIGWLQYTISVWVNIAVAPIPIHYEVFNTYPHTGLAFAVGGLGNTKYRLWVGSGPAGWSTLVAAPSIQDYVVGQWQHLVLVRDGLQMRLYINGALDNTFAMPIVPPSVQCTMTLGSCSDNNICLEMFNGSIDDFTVWKRALSADEIGKLYAGTTPTNSPRYIIRAR